MNKIGNINWVDGMKINKDHFIHNDKLQSYHLKDVARTFLKSYDFGLLHSDRTQERPNIYKKEDYIILHYCEAITRNGKIIHIEPEDKLRINMKDFERQNPESTKFLVLVSIDEQNQIAYGVPNPNELPPRQPFSAPELKIVMVPELQFQSPEFANNYVSVGRVIVDSDQFEIDETYLPPCKEVLSHLSLLDRYLKLEEDLISINADATRVVQNARSKKKRGEINDLAENTFYLMEKIVFFLADKLNNIRFIYKEDSPIQLISCLNSFGRVIHSALSCIKSVDREALLRYYESHLGFKPHQFEGEIKELSQLEYDHINLNLVFDTADQILSSIKSFVSKAVNLEFHSVERVDVIDEKVVKRNKLDIF